MSDLTLAAQMACKDIYAPVTEGIFDNVFIVNEDTVGFKRLRDAVWIVPAGTENTDGWLNDVDIADINVPGLYAVHAGFNQNVNAFVARIVPLLRITDTIKVAGHSRGAPIAALIATQLKLLGFNVESAYLFESPKFCFQAGCDWLVKNIPILVSTRCVAKLFPIFGDPVTAFPEPNPWQPWREPAPQTLVYGSPKGLLKLSAVAYHWGQVVIDAVNASQT